jgi:tetratricopeptide (TPR) repeat protein
MTDSKAQEYITKAKNKMKSFKLLNPNKYEDAIDFYSSAAMQFKLISRWDDAAKMYLTMADIAKNKLKSTDCEDAAAFFQQAGDCLLNRSTQSDEKREAMGYYITSAQMHMENGKLADAAKIWHILAKLDTGTDSIKYFEKAIKCYSALPDGHYGSKLLSCKTDMSHDFIKNMQFEKAIECLENICAERIQSELGRWVVTDHLFMALICQLTIDSYLLETSFEKTNDKITSYSDNYPIFEGTSQMKLMRAICDACKTKDVLKFQEVLAKHERISPSSAQVIRMLLMVKQNLGANGEVAEIDLLSGITTTATTASSSEINELV